MTSALLTRKLRRGFDALDTNSDGVLEETDFAAAARRYLDKIAAAEEGAGAAAVTDGWTRLWREVIAPMDTDDDRRVTFDEFIAAMTRRLGDEIGYRTYLEPLVDACLATADRGDKGWLSPHEFDVLYQSMFRLTPARTTAAFEHLDADSDHRLSLAELRRAVAEYWGSEDENARGNWLFGPL